MKILIVNRALGTLFGGGESFDLNAARFLALRGHNVTLITGKPLARPPRLRYDGFDVQYVPSPNLRRFAYATERVNNKLSAAYRYLDLFLFERAVARWFRSEAPQAFDVVQCCSLFLLPRQILGKLGLPVISWLPGPPSGLVRRLLPELLRHPHFGLFAHGTTEPALKRMALRPGTDFAVIEPGIDLKSIDAVATDRRTVCGALDIPADALLGVTIARFVPFKRHKLLLRGLACAKARGVNWHWVLIGEGPLEAQSKREAQDLGIASQVHFLGYRAQSEVHNWLHVADAFGLTSTHESFSIATLEAIAHRLPVIATPAGYVQRLIGEMQAGVIVEPETPEALAGALADMADPERRSRFAKRGRAFVEQRDWPVIAGKLETLYRQVITGRAV
jgi:glycosyltransferase involved in cell wall biosynthesis